MICDNILVNENGHLEFSGHDTLDLAQQYETPLYVMDERLIRARMSEYRDALAEFFPQGSVPEFASKAFSCKRIYEIAKEEKIHIDVVSCGELYTALKAGFPMEDCFFHGNNKTDKDIRFAMQSNVGHFVVDSFEEIEAVNRIAGELKLIQKVMLRICPGIDPHTHKKISTGSVESKFGFAIETGMAFKAVANALSCENIDLRGFHCHIGSQIFDSEPFCDAAQIMLDFMDDVRKIYGFTAPVLNLGGGFGVRYLESDPIISYREKIKEVANKIYEVCGKLDLAVPIVLMEPGRSLVADAGITLYTVGSVKEIDGYKNYVSVDGGMTDNPRYTLYESPYTVINASKAAQTPDFIATVAGRCCESGDIIQENVQLKKPERGDILAVLTTGAYNYSMASNYNRIPRPPVVMVDGENTYVAVKRESFEDICMLDE